MKWLVVLTTLFSLQSLAQTKTEFLRIMNPKSTWYEVLNVSPQATEGEIKSAYRRLLSTYHPDRHQTKPGNLNAANQAMAKINAARETLLDPLKRKSYDLSVKSTSTMKPAAEKAASDWRAWSPPEFTETKPKPDADPKTKPEPEPEKPKASTETPKGSTSADSSAKSTSPESAKSTDVARTNRPATTLKGKMAQKAYAEVSRCGVGYYKTFIDVME